MGNSRFKFRAWDKAIKTMKEVCLLTPDKDQHGATSCNKNKCSVHLVYQPHYILMQCTGLKDKNGKLIFEGDIISGINGSINGSGMEFKTIIKWNNDNCCFNTPKFGSNENSTHWYEVIGNIYENPELLEINNADI